MKTPGNQNHYTFLSFSESLMSNKTSALELSLKVFLTNEIGFRFDQQHFKEEPIHPFGFGIN